MKTGPTLLPAFTPLPSPQGRPRAGLEKTGEQVTNPLTKKDKLANRLADLRRQIGGIGVRGRPGRTLPFGDPRIDACFPAGGLPLGRLHEIGGPGLEAEIAAAGAAFAAGLLARLSAGGMIGWVLRRADLYPPGLAAFGLHPDRLLLLRSPDDTETLAAMDTLLRAAGIAAVLGELDQLSLTAGRRLQLACEAGGTTAFALRRRLFNRQRRPEATAAATLWQVRPAPSRPEEPGVGRPLWHVDLTLCRGGREGSWTMEACDASGHVRVVAELADRAAEARVA
jgi:protein ImuA